MTGNITRNIKRSLVILLIAVAGNASLWTALNRPHTPVDSAYPIGSFSLNPFKKHQSPYDGISFTEQELEDDIQLLAAKTKGVRLYNALGGVAQLPPIAARYGMTVMASAYLDSRGQTNSNALEIATAVRMAQENANVSHVIIGNETQLHQSVPEAELVRYLDAARQTLKTPVSTAEPWDYWIQHPEFAAHVDFIAIHILPYWKEIPIEQAVDYVIDKYDRVKRRFPDKWVMIAETGWPSDGPQQGAAKASVVNQALFFREFVTRANAQHIPYNIIEAFDQPWKSRSEGRAGEHWGIMTADRMDKFPMHGPVLEDPNWRYWAFAATLLGVLGSALFLLARRTLRVRGKLFSVIVFQLAAGFATALVHAASNEYLSLGDSVFWSVMAAAQLLLALILLTDAIEIADVVGDHPLKQRFGPSAAPHYPFVSLHLATCKEPAEMVIATLTSLAALDYPHFEVIVVDNNTPDPSLWEPVKEKCRALGERFRFFSLGPWPGFKAGALNFALQQTHPTAKIIGVIDADYTVEPDWLKSTVPYFQDADIAVVQAPQEHRDWQGTLFQQMENDEYSGFFRIGMVQRNEHNAIIQHGTMTLIDRATLTALNGWAEWCICEDSELGLRILTLHKKAIYIDHPFGRGLVPASYQAYAKQRFRWAYGAMRILRRYWRELLGLRGALSVAQRYQFIKGWLPWIGDALHMLFTATAIGWSAKLLLWPLYTAFPEFVFIAPAIALFALRIVGTAWTYTHRVHIGAKRTLLAMIAGSSLTHKIAKAVFQGLSGVSQPFYRTPKMEGKAAWQRSLVSVREEGVLAVTLWVLAAVILTRFGTVNNQAVAWCIALALQSLPYLAAVATSLASSLEKDTQSVPDAVPLRENAYSLLTQLDQAA